MNSKVHKQYLIIQDRPVLYYSLKAFEDSAVDEIVLVVGKGEEKFCRKEIVDKYGISKVKAIVEGGKERYHYVFVGLKQTSDADYVLIHDGARPFADRELILRCLQSAVEHGAATAAVKTKDTIKRVSPEGIIEETPNREFLYLTQTPQIFKASLYHKAVEQAEKEGLDFTDDCQLIEHIGHRVWVSQGDYRNIKITTPEDIAMAQAIAQWTEQK